MRDVPLAVMAKRVPGTEMGRIFFTAAISRLISVRSRRANPTAGNV